MSHQHVSWRLFDTQYANRFEKLGKTTRRAQFLADMDRIIPVAELTAAVETVYPKGSDAAGRPTIPPERMLRIYFLRVDARKAVHRDPIVQRLLDGRGCDRLNQRRTATTDGSDSNGKSKCP